MNDFQLTHEMHGAVVVVRIKGSLDLATFPCLENFLTTQFEQQHFAILLDCKDLNYIASFAWGGLIKVTKQSREHGGDLKLVHVPEWVNNLIKLLGFDKVLQIFTQEQEALASFAQPSIS